MSNISRRDLLKVSAAATGLATAGALLSDAKDLAAAAVHTPDKSGRRAARLRFGVVGANHDHIHGMIGAVKRGGGELVSYHIREPEIAAAFQRRYPDAKPVSDERAVLEDPSIQLVLSSITPLERAPLGIRVM